jgi:heptosyltransferase-2
VRSLNPKKVRRLLIRGTNWVGDAVMSIPAMKKIRVIFDRAHISLLVRPWVQDVYAAVDFVDEILVYDKAGIHSGFAGRLRLAAQLRARRFDGAILLQNALDAAVIAWLARIPIRLGYALDGRGILLTHPCAVDPRLRKMHQAHYYLGLLASARLPGMETWDSPVHRPSIGISLRASDRESARSMLREHGVQPGEMVIGLNPGAYYGGAKRWLSPRYAAAADTLAARYRARVVIFGSPEERIIADEVASNMDSRPVILAGHTTLGQLMGLLRECALLITNDSGPMHLAAALDVPQVAIFGSTSETATGPLSSRAVIINEHVDCSPCFLRECPIDFRCMTGISVDRVVEAAVVLLGDRRDDQGGGS